MPPGGNVPASDSDSNAALGAVRSTLAPAETSNADDDDGDEDDAALATELDGRGTLKLDADADADADDDGDEDDEEGGADDVDVDDGDDGDENDEEEDEDEEEEEEEEDEEGIVVDDVDEASQARDDAVADGRDTAAESEIGGTGTGSGVNVATVLAASESGFLDCAARRSRTCLASASSLSMPILISATN